MDLLIAFLFFFFLYFLVPGAVAGCLLGMLPIGMGWSVTAAVLIALLGALLWSLFTLPAEVGTLEKHAINVSLYTLPILLAVFVGLWPARTLK